MKKKILSFLLCVAAALSLTACGEQGQTDSSDSLPKINDLELLSGAATGSWYTIGAGIADKFNDNYDGFPMTAIPGPGSIGNVPVIASGDSEIGMSYGPFLIAAQNGKAPFETSYTNLRAICAMQPTAIQPLTTLDIDTFGEFVNGKIKDTLGCIRSAMRPLSSLRLFSSSMVWTVSLQLKAGGPRRITLTAVPSPMHGRIATLRS